VEPFAETELFAGKNCIARKISGFEIFTRKNFRTKKIASKKNRTLKILHPKKSGFKNSERENFPAQKFSVRKKSGTFSKKLPCNNRQDQHGQTD